jgi:hypothetical protein
MSNLKEDDLIFLKSRTANSLVMEADSRKVSHNDIKNNIKFMNSVIKSLNNKKNCSQEVLEKECVQLLRSGPCELTNIYDESKNTCNYYFKILVVHRCVIDNKLENFKLILDAYYLILDDKEKFFDWFFMENSENTMAWELAAEYSNKEILKYLYEYLKIADETRFKFGIKRNNIFHYSAKSNKPYSIVRNSVYY